MTNIKDACYRTLMLSMLGVTRAISKADMKPPTKWLVFLDSLRVSSDILFVKLSYMDEEVGEEFTQKEEQFERKIGKKKFYSKDELEELKEKRREITV